MTHIWGSESQIYFYSVMGKSAETVKTELLLRISAHPGCLPIFPPVKRNRDTYVWYCSERGAPKETHTDKLGGSWGRSSAQSFLHESHWWSFHQTAGVERIALVPEDASSRQGRGQSGKQQVPELSWSIFTDSRNTHRCNLNPTVVSIN